MTSENRTTPTPAPLPTIVTSLVLHHILRFAFDTMGANSRVLGEWATPCQGWTHYHAPVNWLAAVQSIQGGCR